MINEDEAFKDEKLIDLSEDNLESNENIKNDNSIEIFNDEELELIADNTIIELPGIWENVNKEEILFLFNNVTEIKSKKLKMELLNSLTINQKLPAGFKKEDFDKLIIDALLMLGDRKKAYEIIQSAQIDEESEYENFYKKFSINYLLSSYKLSEACSLRNTIIIKK